MGLLCGGCTIISLFTYSDTQCQKCFVGGGVSIPGKVAGMLFFYLEKSVIFFLILLLYNF